VVTLTFETGEGSGTPPAQIKAKENQYVSLPGQGAMVAPTGKTFAGWKENDGRYIGVGITTFNAGTHVFTAVWVKNGYQMVSINNMMFELETGKSVDLRDLLGIDIDNISIFDGAFAVIPGIAGLQRIDVNGVFTLTADMLYISLRWKDDGKVYITFLTGEGSGTPPPAQVVDVGGSITIPGQGDMIAPSGKKFAGWKTPDDSYIHGAGGSASFSNSMYVLFVAQWEPL